MGPDGGRVVRQPVDQVPQQAGPRFRDALDRVRVVADHLQAAADASQNFARLALEHGGAEARAHQVPLDEEGLHVGLSHIVALYCR